MNGLTKGASVLVFTASGTFAGARGEVVEIDRAKGFRVKVDDEAFPMFFARGELVPLEGTHFAGAE